VRVVGSDEREAQALQAQHQEEQVGQEAIDAWCAMFDEMDHIIVQAVVHDLKGDATKILEALLEISGLAQSSSVVPVQNRCPYSASHLMRRIACPTEGFSCDYCMEEIPRGEEMLDCRYCSLDVCKACASAYGKLPLPPPVGEKQIDQAESAELAEATRNFAVERVIGRGSTGAVFGGTFRGQRVAVKQMRAEALGFGEDEVERQFRRELAVLRKCRHPAIVPLLAYGFGGCQPCLVYPLMEHGSLDNLLRMEDGRSRLSARTRMGIALNIALALEYLHTPMETIDKLCIVHRDVKSANILLDGNMRARLGDVAISRNLSTDSNLLDASARSSTMTRVVGSVGYVDPEYAEEYILTPASDTFSFGVVLLELLTSKPPIDSRLRPPALWRRLLGRLPGASTEVACPIANFPPDAARGLGALATRCLPHSSRDRAAMTTVASELESMMSTVPDAPPAPVRERACVICLSCPPRTRLLPCMHSVVCEADARLLMLHGRRQCPVCRVRVDGFNVGDFDATFAG